VTSRGNEQKGVFKSRKDREKFHDYPASATPEWITQHFTSQGIEVK
jgi:hypothetical protein